MHADGTIAYHVELTDGYELLRCQYNMDENGSFYVTPKRPIIKTKTEKKSLLSNTYDTLNEVMKSAYQNKYGSGAEIKAFYYGTPKDRILIWKKGMNLPKASEKDEAIIRGKE